MKRTDRTRNAKRAPPPLGEEKDTMKWLLLRSIPVVVMPRENFTFPDRLLHNKG